MRSGFDNRWLSVVEATGWGKRRFESCPVRKGDIVLCLIFIAKKPGVVAAPFLFTQIKLPMKKTFYVKNRITRDVEIVRAETWFEAMNEAYWRWGCKISRQDMYNAACRKEAVC